MQAYVTSSDWEEFLAIREDLLLRIIDIIAANGSGPRVSIAVHLSGRRTSRIDDEAAPCRGRAHPVAA